jgi:hypothetical protein
MRSIALDLDRPRRLRFDLNSSRLATTTLQRYLPERADKLKLTDAATLLLQHDQDAIVVFLMAGLSHDDRGMSQRKIEDLVQAQLDKGKRIEDFSMPIIEALEAAGLIQLRRDLVGTEEEANGRPPVRAVAEP